VIEHCTVPGTVALTFDDGPSIYLKSIVDQFVAAGGKATFFHNGDNYGCIYDSDNVAGLRYAVAAGMQIGSHGWYHYDLVPLSDDFILTGIAARLQTAFGRILGYSPLYMRVPYGSYDDRVLDVLQKAGFQKMVMWDVDPADYSGSSLAQQRAIFNAASTTVSHVVLNHDPLQHTAQQQVPFMIQWARDRGLRMVTVGECLGETSSSQWYVPYGNGQPGVRDSTWTCVG
jgi:peptidoglycan/xylan/chitin deacetylase (PgdA/CDA1 family)